MLLACMSLAAGAPTAIVPFELPSTEPVAAWSAALALAGFEAGIAGAGPSAALIPGANTWTLRVRDDQGAIHELAVRPPRTPREREDVAWLAESLVHPMVPALTTISPPAAEPTRAVPPAVPPAVPRRTPAVPVSSAPPSALHPAPAGEPLADTGAPSPPASADGSARTGALSLTMPALAVRSDPPPAASAATVTMPPDVARDVPSKLHVRLDVAGGVSVRPGASPAPEGDGAAWVGRGVVEVGLSVGGTGVRALAALPSVEARSAEGLVRVGLRDAGRVAPEAWTGAGLARHAFWFEGEDLTVAWVPVLAVGAGARVSLPAGFQLGVEARGTWDTRPMRFTVDGRVADGWSAFTASPTLRVSWTR